MTATIRREGARWVEPLGRIGLATQGVLYCVVGLLALQVASGQPTGRADQRGAIEVVAGQSYGRLLLVALTVGLALHCVWRLLLAVRGDAGEDGAKDGIKRLAQMGRAVVYGGLTVAAARIVLDADPGKGGEPQQAASRALDLPGGPVILTAVGVAVIGAGLWHVSNAVTRRYAENLDLGGRGDATESVVVALGSVGYAARGIVFALVGWFLVHAAIDTDPNESAGLDSALKRVAQSEHGSGLLRFLALGLFAFGVYRIVEAWLRKRDALAYA